MKKQNVLLLVLLLMQLVLPVCLAIALVSGWEFALFSDLGYLLLLTAMTVGLTIALCRIEEPNSSALVLKLFPASVVGGICTLWGTQSLLAVPCVVCCCVCTGILFGRYTRKGTGRTLALVLSVLLAVFLVLSIPLDLFGDAMRSVTVMREVPSPDDTYTARVIDADYGATGGDTLVRVYDNTRTVNILLGSFTPDNELGYRGEWGRWDELDIQWLDDHTLSLDGKIRIVCSGSVVRSIWVGSSDEITVDGVPYEDTQAIFEALGKSRATREATIQDHPSEEILHEVGIGDGTLYIYEKNGITYLEQPYQGIWEADVSLLQLLK